MVTVSSVHWKLWGFSSLLNPNVTVVDDGSDGTPVVDSVAFGAIVSVVKTAVGPASTFPPLSTARACTVLDPSGGRATESDHEVVPVAAMKFSEINVNAEPSQYLPLLPLMLTSSRCTPEPLASLAVPQMSPAAVPQPPFQPAAL